MLCKGAGSQPGRQAGLGVVHKQPPVSPEPQLGRLASPGHFPSRSGFGRKSWEPPPATPTRRTHIPVEAKPPPPPRQCQPRSDPLRLASPPTSPTAAVRFGSGPSEGERDAGCGAGPAPGAAGPARPRWTATRRRQPRRPARPPAHARVAGRGPRRARAPPRPPRRPYPWPRRGAPRRAGPAAVGARAAPGISSALSCLQIGPHAHTTPAALLAAPVSSEARRGYERSQVLGRGQGEPATELRAQGGRASDASRGSGRPARFALIASVRSRATAGLSRRDPRHRAGPGRAGGAAGGGEAGRGARAAGRDLAPERSGAERSGGSWRARGRVGAAGGEGRAARGEESRASGGRRGAQETGCRRAGSHRRGGWTQPSLPTERGRRLAARAAQTAQPRPPAPRPRAPRPRRALLGLPRAAPRGRAQETCWVLGWGRPRHPPGEATGLGNSSKLGGSAGRGPASTPGSPCAC